MSDWRSDVCSSDLVHHAHHDDQRGDAEHHRDEADRGDEEDEALALPRKQIAPRDHSFVARKDHAIAVPARKNGDEPLLYGAWAGLATARSPPPGCCEFTTGAAQSYHERSIYGEIGRASCRERVCQYV